jgi:hypothetical protein
MVAHVHLVGLCGEPLAIDLDRVLDLAGAHERARIRVAAPLVRRLQQHRPARGDDRFRNAAPRR